MTPHLYMFDTNAISDMVRFPTGRVAARAAAEDADGFCTSAIVVSELRYGLEKNAAVALSRKVESILLELPILPYSDAVTPTYARVRDQLARAGNLIGITDLFIAAHALSLDLTLITANIREFSRVEGLKVENWLEPVP